MEINLEESEEMTQPCIFTGPVGLYSVKRFQRNQTLDYCTEIYTNANEVKSRLKFIRKGTVNNLRRKKSKRLDDTESCLKKQYLSKDLSR